VSGRSLLFPWMAALALRLWIGSVMDAPTVLSDEVEYFLAARQPPGHPGVWHCRYPPLYPILISGAARHGTPKTGYTAAKVLNAFLSSTVVPLTWPLWQSAGPLAGLVVGLLAPGLTVSGLVLSENLFLPLLCLWLLAASRWRRSGRSSSGIVVGLITVLAILTRAAGGALVLGMVAVALSPGACRHRRVAIPIAFATIPVLVFVFVRMNLSADVFNDPLAVQHAPELARGLATSREQLTQGTVFEPLAHLVPGTWLLVAFWFVYWAVQYVLYLLLGAAYLPLVFLDPRARRHPVARRFLVPLLVVTIFFVLLSANHNLAGKQTEQFVRGRYVEPLAPLWLALSMGCMVMAGPFRVARWSLLPFALLGVVGVTNAQNRSADFLYPFRSLSLSLQPAPRFAFGIVFALAFGFLLWYWLNAVGLRRWLRRGMIVFVLCTSMASVLRLMRHAETATNDALIAHWLADNAPSAVIEIDTGAAPLEFPCPSRPGE
jgi:hypothetical protein